MPTFQYIDGTGQTRNRKTFSGDGTIGSPDVAETADPIVAANITSLSDKFSSLGQKTSALSTPVVIASDQVVNVSSTVVYGSSTLTATSGAITSNSGAFINVERFKRFSLEISNSTTALNALDISTKSHTSGTHTIRLNAASHFTTIPSGSILRAASAFTGASLDFTTLGISSGGVLIFDLRDFLVNEIRIRATVASGTSVLSMLWSGQY